MLAWCPQPPNWTWLRPKRPPEVPWLWVLLAVLVVELCLLPLRKPRAEPMPEPEGAVLVTTDHGWGSKPLDNRIPEPGKGNPSWQKGDKDCKPPFTVLNGYCWAALDPKAFKPPCQGGLYEDRGRCYAPVVKKRPDTSIAR